jgi:hypothetical protein
MAIKRFTMVVCDKCQDQEAEDVQSIEIRRGTEKTKVDLCAEDRKPLDDLIKSLLPAVKGRGGRPRKAAAAKP